MNCLKRADEIVHGDRNSAYGEPADNHQCTADIFNAAMRKKYPWWQDIESEDVCWFNVAQKFSREMNSKTPDGLTDIAGYVANAEIIRNGWSVAAIREERAGGCPEDSTPTELNIEPRFCSRCGLPGTVLCGKCFEENAVEVEPVFRPKQQAEGGQGEITIPNPCDLPFACQRCGTHDHEAAACPQREAEVIRHNAAMQVEFDRRLGKTGTYIGPARHSSELAAEASRCVLDHPHVGPHRTCSSELANQLLTDEPLADK